jgi:uncharacterized membrane protein
MRIGKIGNTTYNFSIIGTIVLSLIAFLLIGSIRGCGSSEDYDSDAYIDSESDAIATQVVDGLFRRRSYRD